MDTKICTIRLRKEQFLLLKDLNLNLSEFVRDKIDEELLSPQEMKVKVQNAKKNLKKWLKIEQSVIQSNTALFKGSSEEKKFLKQTSEIVQKRPELIEGRINLYINTFSKPKKPTRKQFMELLKKV